METKLKDNTLMKTGQKVEWPTVGQSGQRQAVVAQDTVSRQAVRV
jgi:hypothetical protein